MYGPLTAATTSAVTVMILAVGLAPSMGVGLISVTPTLPVQTLFPLTATLSLGSYIGNHTADPFFAILLGVTGVSAAKHAVQGAFFNSTPMSWFRLYGGGDGYDPTTQTDYVAPAGGGTFVAVPGSLVNLTAFKTWCTSRNPTCHWLTFLPAEENNTQAALHYANWYHRVLGLAPTLWEFGNEPTAWTHYGKNMTTWSTKDNLTPTGVDYAVMVRDYISTIRAAYPKDQFDGIESSCGCNSTLVTQTASLDGKRIALMGFHAFPWTTAATTSLGNYYGSLRSSTNISAGASHFRQVVSTSCGICASIPIQLGAYQAGPAGNLSNYSLQHPGAVFLAASVIEALQANVSSFTLFNSNYMWDSANATMLPQGVLAQRILSNLTMGSDYGLTIGSPVGGIFGLVTRNGGNQSVFLVNTNVTRSISFSLPKTVYTPGTVNSYWIWSAFNPYPTAHRSVTLPTSFLLPPQGILLVSSF